MSTRRNTFSRALRQLKSEEIDKKIQLTETLPTNNTMGVFISMPPGAVVSTTTVSRETWGEADLDFDADGESDGTDTTGLFETDGTPKAAMPPGDTSYILGPMSAMYYSWWSGGTTTVGYIRQADRKMVNLGTISGKLHEWDGASFNSYGQLTLEQAQWFKDVKKKDDAGNNPDNANYRAFYPGPPSNTPDANGRYLCTITGAPKDKTVTQNVEVPHSPTEKGAMSADDNFGALLDRLKKGKTLSKAEQDFLNQPYNNPYSNFPWDNNIIKLGSRLLRSLTDVVRYGGDKIVKGLPSDVTKYIKNWDGGGGKIVDYMFGGSKNAQNILGKNWYNTDYFAPAITSGKGGLLKGGEIDVARQYMSKGGTRGTPWGPKSGNYWVGDAPKTGKVGIKNPWGSKISRGWSGTPEVKVKAGTIDAVRMGGDDVAKLATKGAKTSKVLSRLVPGVAIAAATYDVTTRVQSGDYAGAVLGAVSAIPGPVGWLGFGGQLAYDAARAGWFNKGPIRGRSGAKAAMGEEFIFEEVKLASNEKEILDKFAEIGADDYIRQMTALMAQMGITPELSQIIIKSFYGAELGDNEKKIIEIALPKVLKHIGSKKNVKESYLSEDKASRVLKNLKKPIVLPEGKKKTYKVKPGARMRGMDTLIGDIKPQESYKEPQKIWSKNSQGYNARSSQEKKNQVLQYVGASMDHWDYMTDTVKKQGGKIMSNYKDHDYLYDYWLGGTRKKAVRKEEVKGDYVVFLDDGTSMLQSSYNEKVEQEKEKEMFDEYYKLNPKNEPIPYENDPLFKKVSKRLKPVIDYPEKPAKKGYPNEPPPKMVNGWHPEYGKRYKYDKLDPVSAKAMPPTGNPEIDANVEKTKAKPK